MVYRAFLLTLLAVTAFADTGFNTPSVVVSTDDAHAIRKGVQQLILSTGTSLSISGSTAKISVGPGSGSYIQNSLTPTTATQKFSVQTGSATTSFTSPTYIFANPVAALQHPNGAQVFGYQGAFNVYLGQDTTTSTGGGFNACAGYTCMTPYNAGTFSACLGAFCMDVAGGFGGQQDGCIGYACMANMTSGSFNNCNGGSCMLNTTSAQNCVCNGITCLRDNNADYNTCDGQGCLQFNTSGTRNWGIGARSGLPTFDISGSTNQTTSSDMGYMGYATSPGDPAVARSVIIGNYGYVSSSDTIAFRASNLALVLSTGPAVTSCGTNPSIVGNNSAFTVTVGGTTTGCTVGFSQTFVNAPTCVATERTGSITNAFSYTVSKVGMTFSQTALGGAVIDAVCIGSK